MKTSSYERAFRMAFARIYPLYIQKAEKKAVPRRNWTRCSAG